MRSKLGGIVEKIEQNNPSVNFVDSSLYTREPEEAYNSQMVQRGFWSFEFKT